MIYQAGKSQVVANRDAIKEKLRSGHSMRSIYFQLVREEKIDISYSCFWDNCKKLSLEPVVIQNCKIMTKSEADALKANRKRKTSKSVSAEVLKDEEPVIPARANDEIQRVESVSKSHSTVAVMQTKPMNPGAKTAKKTDIEYSPAPPVTNEMRNVQYGGTLHQTPVQTGPRVFHVGVTDPQTLMSRGEKKRQETEESLPAEEKSEKFGQKKATLDELI